MAARSRRALFSRFRGPRLALLTPVDARRGPRSFRSEPETLGRAMGMTHEPFEIGRIDPEPAHPAAAVQSARGNQTDGIVGRRNHPPNRRGRDGRFCVHVVRVESGAAPCAAIARR